MESNNEIEQWGQIDMSRHFYTRFGREKIEWIKEGTVRVEAYHRAQCLSVIGIGNRNRGLRIKNRNKNRNKNRGWESESESVIGISNRNQGLRIED